MKIKTLIPFTCLVDGELFSPAMGDILDVTDSVAAQFIADGLAEEYNLVTPTGTKSITANGENIDVAAYAAANVNVPNPSTGTINITSNGTKDVTNYASANVNVPTWNQRNSYAVDFEVMMDTDIQLFVLGVGNMRGRVSGTAVLTTGEETQEIPFDCGATIVTAVDGYYTTSVWSFGGSSVAGSFFAELAFTRNEEAIPETYSKNLNNAWMIVGSVATDVSAVVDFTGLIFYAVLT